MDPATMQLVQNVAVGAFVVLLMLSVGLDLSLESLRDCLRRPMALLAGLLVGYLVVPALAVGSAQVFGLSEAARAGLVLCAVAPGGPMGAYLALTARGNVALAAALVLIFNTANVLLIPIGLELLAVQVVDSGSGHVWPMARTILLYQLLPMGTGLILHRLHPARARKLQKVTSTSANVILAVFAVAIVFIEGKRFLTAGLGTVLAIEATVILSMLAGWWLAPRDRPARVSLACVSVIHSVSACILLANTWFADPVTLLTVLTWSGCMFTTGVIGARLLAREDAVPQVH